MKSKVYFTKEITKENLVKLYKTLGKELPGKVAVKVHSGEDGNQNFLRPEFMEDIIKYVNGTVVECNTAYDGERNTTEKHLKTINKHGWRMYDFDLMDEEDDDLVLPVKIGVHLKENFVGNHMKNYDSMLVLSHFKGHPMGGFGGALKQLSIGCASSRGKAWIHSAGTNKDQYTVWNKLPKQDDFLESMAESAGSVVDYFHGNVVFINVMANMSVDCDCCSDAEDPCIKDIGMMISLDPVAIDKACVDMVNNSNDPGRDHFMDRVNSRHGIHTIEKAYELGIGNVEYELIEI